MVTPLPDRDAGPAEAMAVGGAGRASPVRLALLILEGYLYLGIIAGIFLGAIALLSWGLLTRRPVIGLIALAIGVPLVMITAATIRSVLFRIPEPPGIPVTAGEAPALHAVVNDLARQLDAPAVHRILIDERFNASALQLPRAGPFWVRNTLILGYPLFATLTCDQMRAVIAHELAHFSRGHGRLSTWVYRTHHSWRRVMATLDSRDATPLHALWLCYWYVPRLQTQSSAIARQQEEAADRSAVAVVGSRPTADALVALAAADALLNPAFWRAMYDRVEHEADPPRPFAEMGPQLWDLVPSDEAGTVEGLIGGASHPDDTHPSLSERLRAIGEPARLPVIGGLLAGEAYLGAHMHVVAATLDRKWQSAEVDEWRRRHQMVRTSRRRLDELAARESPTTGDLFERGQLTELLEGPDSALPHYRDALAQGHPGATLAAGRILLDCSDESGAALIERSMDADPSLAREGCLRLIAFFESRNRLTDAHRHRVRLKRLVTREQMADAERNQLTVVDRFVPHELSSSAVSEIVARLEGEREVTQAFLVKKELRHAAGTQLVLALIASGPTAHDLRARVRDGVLSTATIVTVERHDQALVAALEAVDGARVYARAG